MRARITALTGAVALASGAGTGYAIASDGSERPATKSKTESNGRSMMSGGDGSMMMMMLDAEHAQMMRDPEMRAMHRTMVREHTKMMRAGEMRRRHERTMRDFPSMARMMREHMEG